MEVGKLQREFYLQRCLTVAKELIGKILVRILRKEIYSGIIVETEAYLGKDDPASHAYSGKTKRNEVMFSRGGTAYVYFTYGNHFCFNVVTEAEGIANAVLIRAVEPVLGIEKMKKNRMITDLYNLTSGPGKLAKAFVIDKKLNGADLCGNEIFIMENEQKFKKIVSSERIGITKNADKKFRFYADSNPFVSARNNRTKAN